MAGDYPAPTLEAWLDWQQGLNSAGIDLGLERVRHVGERLGVLRPAVPVINVAGTNGKGSVVAYAEAMLTAAGYRVGAYTSPHVLRYNERIRIGTRETGDTELIHAFETVEAARGHIPLTYFEFGTLAALEVFRTQEVDVLVLEVGLGGRLDAVNAVEPSVAVITSIGLDHADWLGHTLEAVAREKAGIMRPGVPVVLGGEALPPVLAELAAEQAAPMQQLGRDFAVGGEPGRWRLAHNGRVLDDLPPPGIPGPHQRANAASALVALRCLEPRLTLPDAAVRNGIEHARLPGRCQILPGPVEWVLDVAHNADAAAALAAHLGSLPPPEGRCWALFGAMSRKTLPELLQPLAGAFDGWFAVTLPQPDAWPAASLAEAIGACSPAGAVCFAGPAEAALAELSRRLRPGDRVVAFGSFHTVELVLSQRDALQPPVADAFS